MGQRLNPAQKKRRRKKAEQDRKNALTKQQLRQARALLLGYDESASRGKLKPESVLADLKKLKKIPWNEPRKIQARLEVLPHLSVLRPQVLRGQDDPYVEIWALESFLKNLIKRRIDQERRASDRDERLPVGRPAGYLLGLRRMTRNTDIGPRRSLAAQARGVGEATSRRWHERDLLSAIADDVIDREVKFVRSVRGFHVGGAPLSRTITKPPAAPPIPKSEDRLR